MLFFGGGGGRGGQRGFWRQSKNVYARTRDGVHLNSLGQEKYYRISLRDAILGSLSLLTTAPFPLVEFSAFHFYIS